MFINDLLSLSGCPNGSKQVSVPEAFSSENVNDPWCDTDTNHSDKKIKNKKKK